MTLRLAGPLLLVGAGKMGGALLEGWLRQGLDPTAVFIQDRDTSDVWLLDVHSDAMPQRLTAGRDPMPYWEDT